MAAVALSSAGPVRAGTRWALASLVVTALTTVGGLLTLATVPDLTDELRSTLVQGLLTLIPYGLAGAFLLARRPDLPFGRLLAGAAAAVAVGLAGTGPALLAEARGRTGPLVALGLGCSALLFVPIAVQGLVNVRFPSGRPTGRWGRVLDRLLVTGLVAVVAGGLLGEHADEPAARNPVTAGTVVGRIGDAAVAAAPVVVLLGVVAGLGIVVRWRRAAGVERQQLAWRAAGVVVSLALFPLAVTERLGPVVGLDAAVFVATLVVPVVRYRLWAIDTIVRRSTAYAAVTVVLVAAYVLVAVAGARLASERVGYSVAAVAVALAVAPARRVTQRFTDRLFYGRRSDPYRALSDVGRRLTGVAVPGEVLPAVAAEVAASLRLPYVALEGPDGTALAAHGTPGVVERWPLAYEGEQVGTLAASPRRGEAAFDERDRTLLADLARQAGPAVRAEALTADLVDSRQRLVTAREEERRRLRRDLHDGLGPMLAGIGLNLDAARTAVASGTDPDAYLTTAKEVSAQAIRDLRGLVYDLRPPSLDDLGLAGAVRVQAARLGVGIEVAADDLPALPAAVEVAAFRTAVEAVTNAVRHGGASRCTVRLTAGRDLLLEVGDDGRSTGPWSPGVGLTAMRERAAELGGTLSAGPSATGGRVLARYPLVPS